MSMIFLEKVNILNIIIGGIEYFAVISCKLGTFLSRNDENMKQEMTIKCKLLNRMLKVGRPNSVRVA